MKKFVFIVLFVFVLSVPLAQAKDLDYLSRMAAESEIQAIAVVTKVLRVSGGREGSFTSVTFRRDYAVTPYVEKSFVGTCNVLESSWQTRNPGTVYFNPKQGQKVFVTVSTDGGAITSYTLMTPQLDAVIRSAPNRLAFKKGRACVRPLDE